MKEYVIFDLDGTLVDSFQCICRNVNKTLAYLEEPTCTAEQFEKFRNWDLKRLFLYVVNATKERISMKLFKSVFDKMNYYDCIDGVFVLEKTKKILDAELEVGTKIIVLTNKRQEIAERICRELFPSDTFYAIVGRMDETPIKLSPSTVYRVNELMKDGICKKYYGDSDTDKEMAALLQVEYEAV